VSEVNKMGLQQRWKS